jgi:hypothetical protein
MSVNIINDALKFYDSNNEIYKNLAKKVKFVKRISMKSTDVENVKFTFYDENKIELFTSRIEILGKYYPKISTWVWGWSLPDIDKSLTSIIRKVFLYGTDIDTRNFANVVLKNELVTSRFRIEDEIQLDIHCALASYLSKKPFIFAWKNMTVARGNEWSELETEDNEGAQATIYTFILDPPVISRK